jgi:hypothetical protein
MKKGLVIFYALLGMQVTYAQNTPWPATGNVGIGTTSPNAPLHVQGSGNNVVARFYTSLRGNTGGGQLILGNYVNGTSTVNGDRLGGLNFSGTTSNQLMTSSASVSAFAEGNFSTSSLPASIRFYTINTGTITLAERMRITPAGNVGIGTSVPAAKLHVEGTTINRGAGQGTELRSPSYNQPFTFGGSLSSELAGRIMGNSGGGLVFQGFSETADKPATRVQGHVGSASPTQPAVVMEAFKLDGAGGRTVMSGSEKAFVFYNGEYSNGTALMSVLANGNVGIGAFAPAQKLEVNGNIKVSGIILPAGAAAGKVLTSDASGNATWQTATGSSSGWAFGGNAVGALTKIGTTNNYSLPFITNNIERMRIDAATGNVGIGTTNINDPTYKLYVETGIRTRKVKIDQVVWADYVFDPSYKLCPLDEVEQYILQYRHLPDVPSAQDVKINGLDLGDNQATLLRKIEELTLYIIAQNKRIEQLEKKSSY